jgi:hypothetical protein
MKVKTYLAVLFLWLPFVWPYAQCTEANSSFLPGEKVTYHAYYNWNFLWLHAGIVHFSVKKSNHAGKTAYQLKAIGSSLKNYDFFFTVRDTFIAVVDTSTLLPYWASRSTREGSYTTHEKYRFDEPGKVIHSSVSKEGAPWQHRQLQWKSCTVDVLTMVYKARNIDFSKYRPNDKIPIRMVVDGEIHDLYIRYKGVETIKTRDNRTFRCLKFSPLLMEGTIFKKGEDMTVWVTDDKNRIPIMVEAKILIGSVKAMFVEASGTRYPFAAQDKSH